MGSFRLVTGNRHLHRYYNFAGRVVETVPRSLHHSCGSELTRQGIRYLRTVIVTAAVYWGFNSRLAPLLLTFQHRAGVSSYTSSFDLAETCVFAKQSPGPILCGHIAVAPLFPKLRGQFAEFLNYPSPVGLRILFLSTCVGLRYGHLRYSQDFSRPVHAYFPTLISVPYARVNQRPGYATFWVSSCLNLSVATEFLPYVHRLRLSASP